LILDFSFQEHKDQGRPKLQLPDISTNLSKSMIEIK